IVKNIKYDVIYKIGMQFFYSLGMEGVNELKRIKPDIKIFLDLKLHDIPNTVHRASKVLGSLGVNYLTLHTSGGSEMMSAGVEGLLEGAQNAGIGSPVALGVTILTSDPNTDEELMKQRIGVAKDSGCLGLVCSALDLPIVSKQAPDLLTVVPGIRLSGAEAHDQKKVATQSKALQEGAGLLVIGRAVTEAENPTEAAQAIYAEITNP
ncbi:MAG: orotidine-5'-phosphate decarboxylase, partial [Acidimicrobiaceae bacterium]|nr:orotidine-5'-phosphate decarboxylase [Acidimicrobiaceae bacterium]